jgi:hypothetical protein
VTPSAGATERGADPTGPADERRGTVAAVLRRLPGFHPGARKRNVVAGLAYLLGALALLGVVQFLVDLLF